MKNYQKTFCNYALLTASYIQNRCYTHGLKSTPYKAFTGKELNIQNMKIFGTICYAYIQDKKLDSRSEKGIFIGYDNYSAAYFVYIEQKTTRKVRSVTFTIRFCS